MSAGHALSLKITLLETKKPTSFDPRAHHVGSPPTSFTNPWPSYNKNSLGTFFAARFGNERNFVPVPGREELVQIRKPTWGEENSNALKATWIGHASFLVETARQPGSQRGIRILFDPVFSERTSPVSFFGPKRYTPTPCTLDELPDVDAIVISHNHYDHMDLDTIQRVYKKRNQSLHLFLPLNNKTWAVNNVGIPAEQVTELDWYAGARLEVPKIGSCTLICTPAQHESARTPFGRSQMLWSSWVLLEDPKTDRPGRKLYFAGDTGYRAVPRDIALENEKDFPCCPAFKDIGDLYGPFDLALLPIGLMTPRFLMSSVHCSPEDSVHVHKDIRSKRSIGMHYGTVRGGISAQYEDVRDPPRRWKAACERAGLLWGEEIGLCDVGESVVVE